MDYLTRLNAQTKAIMTTICAMLTIASLSAFCTEIMNGIAARASPTAMTIMIITTGLRTRLRDIQYQLLTPIWVKYH